MMQHKKPLPSVSQIGHARRLIVSGLFGPRAVTRLTGVSLRDYFRIENSFHNITAQPLPPLAIRFSEDDKDTAPE